jgi:rhodanese-related sulfurtransferase
MTRKTIEELLAEARAALERLTPVEAHDEVTRGALLIDTRCGDDRRREGVIPESIHIPLSVLEWRVDPASGHRSPAVADGSGRLILICNEGYSSSLAAARLQALGYHDATDVIGGFEAWRAAGLPVWNE